MTSLPTALRQSTAALLTAVLSTGCAELRWHKEGMEDAVIERDFAECQQTARLRAYREAWPFGFAPPYFIGMDGWRYAVTGYPNRLIIDRALLEQDYARECMRGRGYRLVPVEKR